MKIFFILFFLSSIFSYGQYNNIPYEEGEKTTNPEVLSAFIEQNPQHPNIEALKEKLQTLIINKEKEEQMATDIINHLIENDPNKAYIIVTNLSRCDITINFQGQKLYQLDIPSNNEKRVLVEKGSYEISSKICNANYKAQKEVTNDYELVINLTKK